MRAMREVHEFWANIIQIAIATYLLSRELSFAASGPIIVCILSLGATIFVSPLARKYQIGWVEMVQKRIGQ